MLQVKNYFEEKEDIYIKIENEGVIMSIGDGIAKACGLRGVTAGEMVIMGNKSVKGMLNLEHDRVGSFFGNDRDLKFASILKNQLNMDIIIKKTNFVFLILPDFFLSWETYFFFVSLCVLIKLIFYCFFQYEKNLTVTVLEVFRFLSIYFGLLLLFFYMHEYISEETYFAALIEKIQFLKIVLKIVLRAYVFVVIVFNYELLYQVFNDINKFFFYWFDNKLERRLLWHIIFILNYCYIAFIEYLNSFFSFPWVVIVGAFIYLLISMYYIKKSKQYVVNVALKEIIESEKVEKKTFYEKKNGFGNKRFFTKKL